MDRAHFETILDTTIAMAHDFSVETRIRVLIDAHFESGDRPRTLVMNMGTWRQLVLELEGKGYHGGYFWTPQPEGQMMNPVESITTFLGIPILIKDFLPDQEVIVGV